MLHQITEIMTVTYSYEDIEEYVEQFDKLERIHNSFFKKREIQKQRAFINNVKEQFISQDNQSDNEDSIENTEDDENENILPDLIVLTKRKIIEICLSIINQFYSETETERRNYSGFFGYSIGSIFGGKRRDEYYDKLKEKFIAMETEIAVCFEVKKKFRSSMFIMFNTLRDNPFNAIDDIKEKKMTNAMESVIDGLWKEMEIMKKYFEQEKNVIEKTQKEIISKYIKENEIDEGTEEENEYENNEENAFEELKKLKEENAQLKTMKKTAEKHIDILTKRNEQLEKENEKLKMQIETHQHLKGICEKQQEEIITTLLSIIHLQEETEQKMNELLKSNKLEEQLKEAEKNFNLKVSQTIEKIDEMNESTEEIKKNIERMQQKSIITNENNCIINQNLMSMKETIVSFDERMKWNQKKEQKMSRQWKQSINDIHQQLEIINEKCVEQEKKHQMIENELMEIEQLKESIEKND